MKQGVTFFLHIVKLCLPVFCFQTDEMTLSDWIVRQLQYTTPVMAYVDEVREDESTLDLLAASENENALQSAQQEAQENAVQEQPSEAVFPAEEQIAADAVGTPVWRKRAEVNRNKLLDFDYLMKNFYRVDRTTTIDSSEFDPQELLAKDMRIDPQAGGPAVLIYHTHSQEGFCDSDGTDRTSVIALGDRLAALLQNVYGIPVLHHLGKYDVNGRDYAYSNAAPEISRVLAENPSIQVVIDLHRDGVAEGTRLVTEIDGKPMAKVMFFNGLSRTTATGPIDYLQNPYIQDNLALSLQMQIAAAELYPGFTRPVFLKGYRYNMHMCPRSMLIEVGAQTNTYQEAYNAMEPLANILSYVLLGQGQQ